MNIVSVPQNQFSYSINRSKDSSRMYRGTVSYPVFQFLLEGVEETLPWLLSITGLALPEKHKHVLS